MNKPCLFIFRESPYASLRAREGLDAVLAMAAYDQQPNLVFMAEGVWQLVEQADDNGRKNHSKMLQALALYGIENLYVHKPSLAERGLCEAALFLPCEAIDNPALAALIAAAPSVLNF